MLVFDRVVGNCLFVFVLEDYFSTCFCQPNMVVVKGLVASTAFQLDCTLLHVKQAYALMEKVNFAYFFFYFNYKIPVLLGFLWSSSYFLSLSASESQYRHVMKK
eukprot:TRINITY_DN64020_c0_g1_i1.p1 TRINITY_DN64020_c0_g1~~TRINITY_DN64020_c0_g1_i1.p1  ORF type:complete len:104 (-),score=4.81 TRINITY_DN64020_c0_g1_i1:8-319(-)